MNQKVDNTKNDSSPNSRKDSTALEMIVLRNAFYRDGYRRALLVCALLLCVNVLLAGAVIYKVLTPPQPQYFAATPDGRMINWHPLRDAVVSEAFVTQWVATAVTQAFSLDYMHWRSQLEAASVNFTRYGWDTFLSSMKSSNNLDTLTSLKMVSNVTVTAAPKVLQESVVDGRYAWKIELPILVTYSNGTREIPMPMTVIIIVLRVPVEENPNRIAINNFLPVPQKTAQPMAGEY